MIDPSIALNVRNPQLKSPTESYSDLMTLRSMQNQGELQGLQVNQAKQQMADYERNAPTRKLTEFNEREQARFQSILPAAMQTVTYLNNNDVPGAANFLTQRLEALRAAGIDSKDTEEALQALMKDPNSLLQASMGMIDVGRQMGLVQGSANEGFTLSPGQQRFDAMGNPIVSVEDKPNLPTGMQINPETGQPEYMPNYLSGQQAIRGAGATNVSVNTGSEVGTIPPGYELFTDPETGARSMRQIPGSPAERDAADLDQKAIDRQSNRARAGGTVIQDLGRALELIQGSPATTTGFGSYLKGVPTTKALETQGHIDSALSNVGLDTLQAMREASPTGGALGQVPIQQQKRLEQVLGSLDLKQRPEVIQDNIKRIQNIYMDIIHGSPEHILDKVDSGELSLEEARPLMFRHQLSFDEMGSTKSGDDDSGGLSAEEARELEQLRKEFGSTGRSGRNK